MEKSIELFRKVGYKQRYNDNSCIIYDLKEKQKYNSLPDTIIIHKGNNEIEMISDYIEEHTHLGTFSFSINKELLKAINKKIEELIEEK